MRRLVRETSIREMDIRYSHQQHDLQHPNEHQDVDSRRPKRKLPLALFGRPQSVHLITISSDFD